MFLGYLLYQVNSLYYVFCLCWAPVAQAMSLFLLFINLYFAGMIAATATTAGILMEFWRIGNG